MEGDGLHWDFVTHKRPQLTTRADLPQPRRLVAAGQQVRAIWRHRHRRDVVGVAGLDHQLGSMGGPRSGLIRIGGKIGLGAGVGVRLRHLGEVLCG